MTLDAQRGYAKGRAKRLEIISRATAHFGDVGYRGASLREMAASCGLSHPGLLHHFPTKEALLLAVLQHRDEEDALRYGLGTGTGLDVLRRLVALVDGNAQRPGIIELYTVLSGEATSVGHPAHDYFVERYRRAIAEITRGYGAAATAGVLRGGVDPAVAAAELVAVMDGLQIQWLLDGGATDMVAIVRRHVEAHLTTSL